MSESIFKGIATALITPFRNGEIDYDAFGRLIDWQIDSDIDALVVCGTSGESPTLSDDDHKKIVRFTVERVAGRVPVITGTGSNDTAYAMSLVKYCCEVGADAMLVVTPYYNKATQNGLVKSFHTIADASTKPIIVYNVPSRTTVDIKPETYVKLAEHENIRAIKEANGNISSVVHTQSLLHGKLDIYTGNDDQIVPTLAMGGMGGISVLSNLLPKETKEICTRFWSGDVAGAAELQCKYRALISALFSEVNPIPVKAAMSAMGFCADELRLPLTPMEDATRANLLEQMRKVGINV